MRSIRSRTAALVAGSVVALLTIGGGALVLVIRVALTAQFDDALTARAEALRSLIRFDGKSVEMDFAGEAMPQFVRGRGAEGPEYFIAWIRGKDDWRVLERSESLRDIAWPNSSLLDEAPGTRDLQLPGDRPGRGFISDFVASAESDDEGERASQGIAASNLHAPAEVASPVPRVRLLVAVSRGPLDHTLGTVAWSVAGVGVALAVATVLLVRWAVGRGLSPLTDLSRRVQSIGADSLAVRFESDRLPNEVRPIAEQLSALLARLDDAFERERRFTAAASHELRTPVAELRMLLEVARSRPRTSDEWHETSGRALDVVDRAQVLCETLLRYSRASVGPRQRDPECRADVSALVAEHVARAVALHGGDGRIVRIQCESGVTARIDSAALGVILANLLDNALAHGVATADEPVTVHARAETGHIAIEIANGAPDLTDDDLSRMFEPFWRKDASRRDQRGFGLGLAVAQAMAQAAGGSISARLSHVRSVTLAVTLPST